MDSISKMGFIYRYICIFTMDLYKNEKSAQEPIAIKKARYHSLYQEGTIDSKGNQGCVRTYQSTQNHLNNTKLTIKKIRRHQ